MYDHNDRFYAATRRFKQLQLVERLGILPQGETAILQAVQAGEAGDRCGVSDIARRLEVSPPAISRTLRHLRERGLVDGVTAPDDRRTVYLRLTAAGRAALEETRRTLDAFMRRALARLEPGEMEEFYRLLTKIYDSVKAELDIGSVDERKD